VTFHVSTDGTLSVKAHDSASGKETAVGPFFEAVGVALLFDWRAIGGQGTNAWQAFCESCDPKHLVENDILINDVWSDACGIKPLEGRAHAFCIALPGAPNEQVNYIRDRISSRARQFLLPEMPFVPPALACTGGHQIGRINFEGVFTLYDGDYLWVLLRAAKAGWNCSVHSAELNRFLMAVKSCSPVPNNEMAIYARAVGVNRSNQALANFRSEYSRSLAHWSEQERPARQRECEEFIALVSRALE
jgi:hypothetical protein